MPHYLFTLDEKENWNQFLNRLPHEQQDIYFRPDYYELYENNGEGKAVCFVFVCDEGIALYPFLINSVNELGYDLNEEYYDIQGAYGYNGVATSNNKITFKQKFENTFTSYCNDSNIIAEFTRFNPILNNTNFSDYLKHIRTNNEIIVDLNHTEKYTWEKVYDSSVRKNVKKAIRNGLTVKAFEGNKLPDFWFNEFVRIYFTTLKRRSADEYYYFSKNYFSKLKNSLNNNTLYFFTVFKDVVVSCELVTHNFKNAYSFLGGTIDEYFSYRPNDILKHEIINYLRNMGMKNFCLGGGVKENDGIYKYKKSFSKNGEKAFYIGTKIYNKIIYDSVCKFWSEKFPQITEKFSGMFLKYRKIKLNLIFKD